MEIYCGRRFERARLDTFPSPHTYVIGNVVQQANFVQMCGGTDGECEHIPNGLVEARVGASAQRDGQVLVLEVVLYVAHLVVYCVQLLHRDACALLNPGVGIMGVKDQSTGEAGPRGTQEHRAKEDSVLG